LYFPEKDLSGKTKEYLDLPLSKSRPCGGTSCVESIEEYHFYCTFRILAKFSKIFISLIPPLGFKKCLKNLSQNTKSS